MPRNIVIFILFFFFTGCAIKESIKDSRCCPKLFEDEDRYIMSALYFRQIGAYKDSAKLFHTLYDKTKRVEYKLEEIKNYMIIKEYEKAKNNALRVLKKYPNNEKILRLLAMIYLHAKDLKSAKEYILKAIKISKDPQDYEFLASIYIMEKKYNEALKYLQSSYAIKPNDKTVDQMATIMFLYLDKKNEAIAYLETHSRVYGCSKIVCKKLISFYGAENNIDGILSTYQRLYKKYKDEEFGLRIVEIYILKKDYKKAIEFLEETKINDELLLDLYKIKKDFAKAAKLAYKLYIKTGDLNFLAQNAIFEFESTKKRDKEFLKKLTLKLEKVIKKIKDGIYLNYLGYIYIDYDMDIDRGIELVKEALKQNPQSPYYLDSLAWGYYKKGRCKEAMELMEKVVKIMGSEDEEVKLHYKKIKDCLKGKK